MTVLQTRPRVCRLFLLTAIVVITSDVQATLFINDDAISGQCSTVGQWVSATKTCRLKTDVPEAIQIDSSDTTLDCKRHIISGGGTGITLVGSGITVKNCEVSGFARGIRADSSGGHTITGNDIHNVTQRGIDIDRSDLTSITNNHVHDMTGTAIRLLFSSNNYISGNIVDNISNGFGIIVVRSDSVKVVGNQVSNVQPLIFRISFPSGEFLTDFFSKFRGDGLLTLGSVDNEFIGNTVSGSFRGIRVFSDSQNVTLTGNTFFNNDFNIILQISIALEAGDPVTNRLLGYEIDTTNTVDGKPVLYLKNLVGAVIDSASNAGMVYCIACIGVTIKDLTVSNNGVGVALIGTTDSLVRNITAVDNNFGVMLVNSDSNTVESNNVTVIDTNPKPDQFFEGREFFGIFLANSSDNDIAGNTITLAHRFAQGIALLNPFAVAGAFQFSSTLNRIDSNWIDNDGFVGIHLKNNTNFNTVTGNTIVGPEFQIQIFNSSDNEIEENLMTGGGAIQVRSFGGFPADRNSLRKNVNFNGTEKFGFGFGFDGLKRVPEMEAGFFIQEARDTIMTQNVVTLMKGDGILLQDDASTQVSQNDIYLNDGFGVSSTDAIFLDIQQTGNYWGHDCPMGPFFVPGRESNSSQVLDRHPFGIPVANLDSPPQPPCGVPLN